MKNAEMFLMAIVLSTVLTVFQSHAAVRVWDGGGTDTLASNPLNWDGDTTVPTTGDDVLLDATSSDDLTWDLSGVTISSWTQTADYTGQVTICTVYPDRGSFTDFAISGNCVLTNGTWTHLQNSNNTAVAAFRLKATIGGDFYLGSDAKINVDYIGYRGEGRGPGKGNTNQRGASHGGQGDGMYDKGTDAGITYGSITEPVDLGSSARLNVGGGGGAVHLTVAGDTTLQGTITSLGYPEPAGPAAGGSIFIRTASLTGNGLLDVSSVRASFGRGGGGRIGVVLTSGTTFGAVRMQAYGATEGSYLGAAGTIYRQRADQAEGQGSLIIDNNGTRPAEAVTMMPASGVNLGTFSAVIITNGGTLGINSDTVIDLGDLSNFKLYGNTQSYIALLHTNYVTLPNPLVISNYTLVISDLTVNGDVKVAATGGIAQRSNQEKVDRFGLLLTVNGNLTVDQGGWINADTRGFISRFGPAPGDVLRGASHGGVGGVHTNDNHYGDRPHPPDTNTYGSVVAPSTLGGGGYAAADTWVAGGGRSRIQVAGETVVDGLISANGGFSGTYGSARMYGQGAGGSIWLTTGTLRGDGIIEACGGSAGKTHYYAGGGGGGRVAVYVTNGLDFGEVSIRTWGGAGTYGGAAGTVYRETMAETGGRGEMIVANNNVMLPENVLTHYPALIDGETYSKELADARVVVAEDARLKLLDDVRVNEMTVGSNSVLDLNFKTLKIGTRCFVQPTGQIINYGEIIRPGLTLIIR